ncbi:MAG TPA: (2Fe-2S)-binding protein [Acetobacteraceae bacterium]|jgi:carbon-monoxide dehydrogenase small subunit|nr:(2Fe-2S)-binding protein [Acetobacteraceae bacterium]
MKSSYVSFVLNGEEQELLIEPGRRLVDVLREQCGAMGTKNGCGQGSCGACTVHINGVAMLACLLPAELVDGAEIVTIEGIARNRVLHALQEAFLARAATQCGFCTAGMIMAAKALLDRDPSPSRKAVSEALSGNVCRCTGYEPIIAAVLAAAAALAKRPVMAAAAAA